MKELEIKVKYLLSQDPKFQSQDFQSVQNFEDKSSDSEGANFGKSGDGQNVGRSEKIGKGKFFPVDEEDSGNSFEDKKIERDGQKLDLQMSAEINRKDKYKV